MRKLNELVRIDDFGELYGTILSHRMTILGPRYTIKVQWKGKRGASFYSRIWWRVRRGE